MNTQSCSAELAIITYWSSTTQILLEERLERIQVLQLSHAEFNEKMFPAITEINIILRSMCSGRSTDPLSAFVPVFFTRVVWLPALRDLFYTTKSNNVLYLFITRNQPQMYLKFNLTMQEIINLITHVTRSFKMDFEAPCVVKEIVIIRHLPEKISTIHSSDFFEKSLYNRDVWNKDE